MTRPFLSRSDTPTHDSSFIIHNWLPRRHSLTPGTDRTGLLILALLIIIAIGSLR